jgi:catechol 2,3-dioxygenase-like lactoylglutathione lyase family enzyme
MTWQPGTVGHFGLAVSDPKASATWWIEHLHFRHAFDFPGGVAIETDGVTMALHEGRAQPATLGHLSFHLPSMQALREALTDLRAGGVDLEDPGDEIGPEAPGSPHLGLWFHDPDGYRWELSVQNAQ